MEKISAYLRYNGEKDPSELQIKINNALESAGVSAAAYSVSAAYRTSNGMTCPAWAVWFNADLLVTECIDSVEFNLLREKRYEKIANALKAVGLVTVT